MTPLVAEIADKVSSLIDDSIIPIAAAAFSFMLGCIRGRLFLLVAVPTMMLLNWGIHCEYTDEIWRRAIVREIGDSYFFRKVILYNAPFMFALIGLFWLRQGRTGDHSFTRRS